MTNGMDHHGGGASNSKEAVKKEAQPKAPAASKSTADKTKDTRQPK